MRINSITTAGVATSVWTNATRTLTNPSGVFSDATRTLTAFGRTLVQLGNTSLAASSSVDLRPASNLKRTLTVAVASGAGAGTQIQQWNGTTSINFTSVAASASGGVTNVGGSTVGLRLNNTDGANAATYNYSGSDDSV